MSEQPPSVRFFPSAAQPDIVRTVQKDKLCLHILEASVTEVVQSLLGPAAVFRYRQTLQVLTAALYYGGSTGIGRQTLGEEYCDVLQVASARLAPSMAQRSIQVILQSLPPNLLPRLHAWSSSDSTDEPITPSLPEQSASRNEHVGKNQHASNSTSTNTYTLVEPDNGKLSNPPRSCESTRSSCSIQAHPSVSEDDTPADETHDRMRPCFDADNSKPSPSTSRRSSEEGNGQNEAIVCIEPQVSTVQRCTHLLQQWKEGCKRIARNHGGQIAGWTSLLVQLHLAFFYLRGRFFQVPKTLTGTEYVYIGNSFTPRRYYGIMGVLLIIQLGVQAYKQLRTSVGMETIEESSELQVKAQYEGCEQEEPATAAVTAKPELVTDVRRCPLCLSNRVVSTATRCGHVFCWNCIVQWCQHKSECPICRAASTLQDLVPLAHAEF